jgi:CBS domain-containing protein
LPVIDGVGRLLGVLSLHDLARSAAEEHRWFSGVTMREVARTFAEVSRSRHAPEALPKNNLGYAV